MAEKQVKLFSNTFMAGAFALANFVLVLLLMWTTGTEYAPEWKKYQREYYRLLAARLDDPAQKQKTLAQPLEVKQVWNPKLGITDRCMTCHMGVSNPVMKDVPQPYAVHPDFTQHRFSDIGCTVCHEGQGTATTVHAAHVMADLEGRFGPYDEQHAGWSRPLLPLEYVQSSCNKCHPVMQAPVPGANYLNAGWQLVQEKGCRTCHYIVDSGAKIAPELSTAGTKFFNASGHSEAFHDVRFGYLKESVRCPQANLTPEDAEKCTASLPPPEPPAAGGDMLSGANLVKKYQCVTCHNFDKPGRLVGPSLYDVGKRQQEAYIRESILEPNKVIVEGYPAQVMQTTLSGTGLYKDIKQNPAILDNLVQYLLSHKGSTAAAGERAKEAAQAAPAAVMPNFRLNDEELHNVVVFLLSLREHTVSWPQVSFAKPSAKVAQSVPTPSGTGDGSAFVGKSGPEVVKLAGCNVCHKFDAPGRLVGPSLWDIGARQDKTYIRESILEPDKVIVAGFPKGLMSTTLTGSGFYKKVSLETLNTLVDYLASLKGKS
jgi:putative heme-binding domain-containing protein